MSDKLMPIFIVAYDLLHPLPHIHCPSPSPPSFSYIQQPDLGFNLIYFYICVYGTDVPPTLPFKPVVLWEMRSGHFCATFSVYLQFYQTLTDIAQYVIEIF